MAYQLITSIDSPNFTPAASVRGAFGYPRDIIGDTIHHWDAKGSGATWNGTVATLTNDYRNPGSRGVSAHFVVETGRVACLVSPVDAAWHSGNPVGNAQTIGWELNPDESDGTYQTFAEALARSWVELPRPHKLFPHNHWAGTECPGGYDLPRLLRMAEAEYQKLVKPGSPAPAKPTTPAPAKPTAVKPAAAKPTRKTYPNDQIHWVVDKGDTLSKIAKYYGVPDRVAQIASYNGIDPNKLKAGDKIWIPGELRWVIEAPDTIRSVAKYYGLDAGYLARLNGLPGPDATIYVGNTLVIKK